MNWVAWTLLGWLAFSAFYQVYLVDRPREPKTHFEAIAAIVEIGLACWAVVYLATT
jgi:hypothetical protein